MDPRHHAEAELFRKRIRAFLDDNLPEGWHGIGAIADRDEADAFVASWRATLAANGLLGRGVADGVRRRAGCRKLEQVVLVEELARAGVPAMGYNDTFGIKMLGGTLLRWGTEDQKRRFLPRILVGRGPLVPGLLRARIGLGPRRRCRPGPSLDGDRWVIDGQKLWTSRAREANWIFLLARTDPAAAQAPGHLVPARADATSPASRCGPITAMSGESEFNEVFFDGATTPPTTSVGQVDGGWAVAIDAARPRAGRGGGHQPDPVPGRARPPRWRWPGSGARPTTPSSATGSPMLHIRCEVMRLLGLRILTGVLSTGSSEPRRRSRSSTGASTTSGPPASRSTCWARRRWWSRGAGPLRAYRTDDPGRAEHLRLVDRDRLQRGRRHHLRRHIGGAAHDHRRVGARAPP